MLTINELEKILYSSDDFKYFKKSGTDRLIIITETYFIATYPFYLKDYTFFTYLTAISILLILILILILD